MSSREYQPCSVSAQYGVARENLLSKVILGSFSKLCLMLQILESTKCKCKYFCWVLWQNLWLSNFNSDLKKKKRLLIMRGRWRLLMKRLNAWLWVPSNISLSRPRIFQGQNLLGWTQRKFPRPYPRPEELELQEIGLQKYAKNRPTKQKVQLGKKKKKNLFRWNVMLVDIGQLCFQNTISKTWKWPHWPMDNWTVVWKSSRGNRTFNL